jgi:hypothetical protein
VDLVKALTSVDVGTIVMVAGLCVLWTIVGWNLCKMRHKQRGIEVDNRVPHLSPTPKVGA